MSISTGDGHEVMASGHLTDVDPLHLALDGPSAYELSIHAPGLQLRPNPSAFNAFREGHRDHVRRGVGMQLKVM